MKFEDLKDYSYLSYDFYIPTYDTLIEYQGIQHYRRTLLTATDEKLSKQIAHDSLKREYACNNGFNLIEIPYTAYDMDKVAQYLLEVIA